MENEILEKQLKMGRLEDSGDVPKVVLVDTVSFLQLTMQHVRPSGDRP